MDRMNREVQKYDTISKKGIFYRIVDIDEAGVITAKRAHKDSYTRQGRPVIGTKEELEKRGYRFHDIPPVNTYQEEKEEDMDELKKRIDELEQENIELKETLAQYRDERTEMMNYIEQLQDQIVGADEVIIKKTMRDKIDNALRKQKHEINALQTVILLLAQGGKDEID